MVDPRLQLRVRIVVRPLWLGVSSSAGRAGSSGASPLSLELVRFTALDAIVGPAGSPCGGFADCLRPQRFLDFDGDAGCRAFAISRTAREKSAGRRRRRVAPIDCEQYRPVAGDLEAHALLERRFDLSTLHPDVGVRPVQDDADALGREGGAPGCELSRTFLIVGTSSPHRGSSSSVQSSVLSARGRTARCRRRSSRTTPFATSSSG